MYLYHGSHIEGIKSLNAYSVLHGTDKRVLYLTDNIPYALLYVWDSEHNFCTDKHVTGWVKGGIAHYEEQFPDQLETFYGGVSGYLYCVKGKTGIKAYEERECIYYSACDETVDDVIYVPDVYEELLRYESLGEFEVRRFNEQSPERQEELTNMIAQVILRSDFYKNDSGKATFYRKYFGSSWERAANGKQA